MSEELVLEWYPVDTENLPDGWTVTSVGDACTSIQSGFASGRHNSEGEGVPHLRPMNVSRYGELDLADLRFVDDRSEVRLRPGDVLFNNTNSPAWVGKTALVGESGEIAFSNHMTRLRTSAAADPAFLAKQLHHLQQTGYFRQQCNKHVNQASISSRFLASAVPVVLPPVLEQRRIVARIEELQARTRRAREALDGVPTLLERLRQSVLASAFRGDLTADWRESHPDAEPASVLLERIRAERRRRWEAAELKKMRAKGKEPRDDRWKENYEEPEPVDTSGLPELPEGWAWANVGELADVGTGATPKRSELRYYQDGNVPWITSGALNADSVVEASEYVTEAALRETNLTLYPSGTLLIAMYGEGRTRGKCSELLIPATTNQAIAAVVLPGAAARIRAYLKLALQAQYEEIRKPSAGGVQPNLNLGLVRQIPIPLAPLAEQEVIVGRVAAQSRKVKSIRDANDGERHRLDLLDQSILARAFRGELVPQDPNDEPAIMLLERVRAIKSGQTVSQGGRSRRQNTPLRTPRKKADMTKSRKDNDVMHKPYLASILRQAGGDTSVENLFRSADLPVADFFKQLAWEVDQGYISNNPNKLEVA